MPVLDKPKTAAISSTLLCLALLAPESVGATPLGILAIGDSNTAQIGPYGVAHWPTLLDREPALDVTNIGRGGATTLEAFAQWHSWIEPALAGNDLAVIVLGTNDAIAGFGRAEYGSLLGIVAERIVAAGLKVMLVGPPPSTHSWGSLLGGYETEVTELCTTNHYICGPSGILDVETHLKSDRIHLNQRGSDLLADAIYAALPLPEPSSLYLLGIAFLMGRR